MDQWLRPCTLRSVHAWSKQLNGRSLCFEAWQVWDSWSMIDSEHKNPIPSMINVSYIYMIPINRYATTAAACFEHYLIYDQFSSLARTRPVFAFVHLFGGDHASCRPNILLPIYHACNNYVSKSLHVCILWLCKVCIRWRPKVSRETGPRISSRNKLGFPNRLISWFWHFVKNV